MKQSSGLPVQSNVWITGSPRPNRLRFLTYQLTNAALNLLCPPQCIGCKKRVGSVFCQDCQRKLAPASPTTEIDSPRLERRSTAMFDGTIRNAIHELKYAGCLLYAKVLDQRLLAERLRSSWQATLLVSLPLLNACLRERGFNQSALLADYLSIRTGIPFAVNAGPRVRETRSQVGLNSDERQPNVAGAFTVDANSVRGHRIVGIDDVFTTGAKVRACARALLDAGASKVWALTVASAESNDGCVIHH